MATLAAPGAGPGTKTLTAGSDTEHPPAREIRQIVRIS